MRRYLTLGYGVVCYVVFLAAFLYLIGFINNAVVPKGIDSGIDSGGSPDSWMASLVNIALIALFGVQHSVMARPGFKQRWQKIVPQAVERSTYVLVTSVVLALLYWLWQPMPARIWSVNSQPWEWLLWIMQAAGWGVVLVSTFLISHWHLFGLRQVHEHSRNQPLSEPEFKIPSLYKSVRHPMMLGFLIAFWADPQMSVGHMIFSAGMTLYILIALPIEERDLVRFIGAPYRQYQQRVPMLLPWRRSGSQAKKTRSD